MGTPLFYPCCSLSQPSRSFIASCLVLPSLITLHCFYVPSGDAGAGTGGTFTAATKTVKYGWSAAGCTECAYTLCKQSVNTLMPELRRSISTCPAGSCLQPSLQSSLHITRDPGYESVPGKTLGLSGHTATELFFSLQKQIKSHNMEDF